MTIIAGESYTQLNFLNVTDVLRVEGEVVTPGGGDVIGPASSRIHSLPMWDNTLGTLLEDTGILVDGDNNITFTPVGSSVGIDWSSDIRMAVDSGGDVLDLNLEANGEFNVMGWNFLPATSTFQGGLFIESASVVIASATFDGAGSEIASSFIKIDAQATDVMTVQDGIDSKGLVYDDDYSGAFTPRSLVDKAYVDAAGGTAIDIRLVTGASQLVTITSAQIAVADSLYIIKDADGDASSDFVTIESESTETIDGSTDDAFIVADYGCLRLVSDGNNLFSW